MSRWAVPGQAASWDSGRHDPHGAHTGPAAKWFRGPSSHFRLDLVLFSRSPGLLGGLRDGMST